MYRMPPLPIMGVTATKQSFSLAYCYMATETEDDYMWAVTQLTDLVQTLNRSNAMVFVTGRQMAHMNAIKRVFSAAYNLIYIWLINIKVLADLKKQFATSDGLEDFMEDWFRICNTVTQPYSDYERQAMKAKNRFVVSSYLDRHGPHTRKILSKHGHVIFLIKIYL